ncbi:MAG: hypothetical protein R3B06_10075 [Kofleriaceae bacterium]
MSWTRCSACKRDLDYGVIHWVCSVSTCNRHNTNYKFCSVPCWDSHVATLRHRDAWAVEERAPSREAAASPAPPRPAAAPVPPPAAPARMPEAPAPRRVIATPPASGSPSATGGPALAPAEAEMLIVVSKLKKYIRERSGMNTSDAVADVLSEHVRAICDDAIRTAAAADRKTVLDRDVPKPRR